MNILIIAVNREKQTHELVIPFGAYCVAANAKKHGFNVSFLDLMFIDNYKDVLFQCIKKEQPQFIGISIRNIDNQDMQNPVFYLDDVKDIIDFIKEITNVPIILGGAGFSIFPEECLKFLHCSYGVVGEGEAAFVQIIYELNKHIIENGKTFLLKSICEKNLDSFVLPDNLFLTQQNYNDIILPVQTRRGCPLNCIYCSTASIEGCAIRYRNIDIFTEWLSLWANKGINNLHFVDNTFNMPPLYAKKLLKKIIEKNISVKFQCIIYPNFVDEEMVFLLKEAGCYQVGFGFESGCERILKTLNKQYDKNIIYKTSTLFHKYNIEQIGFLLLGAPGEDLDSIDESLNFVQTLPIDALKITIGIRIYPNTRLASIAKEENIIDEKTNLLFPTFYLSPLVKNTIDAKIEAFIKDTNVKVLF